MDDSKKRYYVLRVDFHERLKEDDLERMDTLFKGLSYLILFCGTFWKDFDDTLHISIIHGNVSIGVYIFKSYISLFVDSSEREKVEEAAAKLGVSTDSIKQVYVEEG